MIPSYYIVSNNNYYFPIIICYSECSNYSLHNNGITFT
jgi:hypothetical protein